MGEREKDTYGDHGEEDETCCCGFLFGTGRVDEGVDG